VESLFVALRFAPFVIHCFETEDGYHRFCRIGQVTVALLSPMCVFVWVYGCCYHTLSQGKLNGQECYKAVPSAVGQRAADKSKNGSDPADSQHLG
jgi:hypothetical protein